MQLAVFGNQRASLAPDWTRETAVSILGDVRLDASAGAGPDAKLTFIGIFRGSDGHGSRCQQGADGRVHHLR